MQKFCTTCGKPLQFENTEICPSCGVRVQNPTAENIAKNPASMQSLSDPGEKDKHYKMDLYAIGIALFYFIISSIVNIGNEILAFAGIYSFDCGSHIINQKTNFEPMKSIRN